MTTRKAHIPAPERNSMFIVTKDDAGNDRVFAGCKNMVAEWTLIPERMEAFRDFPLALSIARQFADFRIVNAPTTLGPRVVTTGAPDYRHLIP